MKLVGVAMVRNEGDLLEAFVRHNLSILDRLVVIDHASLDGSDAILASLVREGLPLVTQRSDVAGFPQPQASTALVRRAFADEGADFVIPLDGDEFLKVASRPALEAALAAMPPGHHAWLPWLTYVPPFDAALSTIDAVRRARRVFAERHGLSKVIVASSFARQPDALIELGHHAVRAPGAANMAPHAMLSESVAAVAHVPVRSAAQFAAKIAIGWLAKLATPGQDAGQSFHWRDAFGYLRSGRPLTPLHLASVAVNYSVLPDRWLPVDAVPLVDDPFLADLDLRYSAHRLSDPLALLLSSLAHRGDVDAART